MFEYEGQLYLAEYDKDFAESRLLAPADVDFLVLRMGFLALERHFDKLQVAQAFLRDELNAYFKLQKADTKPLTKVRVLASMKAEEILEWISSLGKDVLTKKTPEEVLALMDTLLQVEKFKGNPEIQNQALYLKVKCFELKDFDVNSVGSSSKQKLDAKKSKFPNVPVDRLEPEVDISIAA